MPGLRRAAAALRDHRGGAGPGREPLRPRSRNPSRGRAQRGPGPIARTAGEGDRRPRGRTLQRRPRPHGGSGAGRPGGHPRPQRRGRRHAARALSRCQREVSDECRLCAELVLNESQITRSTLKMTGLTLTLTGPQQEEECVCL